MKAIIVSTFGGPETMKYTEVAMPVITEQQVLIRVSATSVNFADIKSRYGKKGNGKLPFIPGIDAAGIVEQVGSAVTNIQVGQRVIAFPNGGSYAEYIAADKNLTFVLPNEIDFTIAAALFSVLASEQLVKNVRIYFSTLQIKSFIIYEAVIYKLKWANAFHFKTQEKPTNGSKVDKV